MAQSKSNLPRSGVLNALAHDRAGNTLAMIAAALFPLLALVGGGVDMGRSYLSQTRLQQACDAGVLAARKKLGSAVVLDGHVPEDVATIGNRFFNLNFRDGAYGTDNRNFEMTLENDYAITGAATVDVPTTIMNLFGYNQMPISVTCEARLNFSNTDIMMVLDTTGSMKETNPGDSMNRIEVLRSVAKSFHAQIEGSKKAGTRVRYGFVPYATNVNVGNLLKSDWMVDKWKYQSREHFQSGTSYKEYYTATYDIITDGLYDFTESVPACTSDTTTSEYGPTTTVSLSPHEYWYVSTTNGDDVYNCIADDKGGFLQSGRRYTNHVVKTTLKFSYSETSPDYSNEYKPVEYDVSPLKGATGEDPVADGKIVASKLFYPKPDGSPNLTDIWYNGCIEERDTYPIDDYDNVDFSRALDLDLDLVPTPGDPATQWRPQLKDLILERSMWWDGTGTFTPAPVVEYYDFLAPGWISYAVCPGKSRKLDEMNASDFANYVDGLPVGGTTYHDIGMIWGGRLLSPTGLFADENADVDGKPTSRHLIFLTDGKTEAIDVAYGAYGVEPLDQRRWTSKAVSGIGLKDVVEKRFSIACEEVKKRNITVWIIGFGVGLDEFMTKCAGPGHHYEAKDAAELQEVFGNIASQLGDLRISK